MLSIVLYSNSIVVLCTMCIWLLLQKVERYYLKKAEIGVSGVIELLSRCKEIDLDIPVAGIEVAGWSLFPLNYPQVSTLVY